MISVIVMKVLVTGAAGFIGSALSDKLARRGDLVLGVDNLSPYYDVNLKHSRLSRLKQYSNFQFSESDIGDMPTLRAAFDAFKPDRVVNLAAQAGVRYSLTHPETYVQANLVGFANILECCRHASVEHLVYASSSSVYGANTKLPFSVEDSVDHPVSFYAATKKANEVMAHSYSHLYNLPTTGLRFFTVYGPWGRPDMSFFLFADAILNDRPIELFNYGQHRRDFTFIDDIIEGVTRVLDSPAQADSHWDAATPRVATSSAPYRLYNIGNNSPVWLEDMVSTLEEALGKKAIRKRVAMAQGDVKETYADVDALAEDFDFRPKTSLKEGTERFVDWFKSYYGFNKDPLTQTEREQRVPPVVV